ncbi:MAG TPA: hypothetical protein VFF16_18135 [Telluria sp.]|nr:hypothetical protein [Telluria sp.]
METKTAGRLARRCTLTLALTSAALGLLNVPAAAQSQPKTFVVYDEELKNGWQNWSWAKVEAQPVAGGKAFKVEGAAWTALLLHHDLFSTSAFSKLRFYVNGGAAGGQTLAIRAMANGKAIDSNYLIQPKPKTWAVVEVPLKDIGADNKDIDGVMLQGLADAYKPYYITRIEFE